MKIAESHMAAICEVAAAMRITVKDFLTKEVEGITPEQAREFLKAFADVADDSKILTAYYLIRATTEQPHG